MPLIQVIILALVQGFTEFLPVSSTAHLYLTSWLLGWEVEGLDFDIALHLDKQAETTWRNPFVIGVMLIAVGVVMWLAENAARKQRGFGTITAMDAIAIGFAQAIAIIPGTSRSGITITAGLFRNLTRESAARFSFLLSTPIIAAAAGKSLYEMHKAGHLHDVLAPDFLVGVALSGLSGCVVIAWFLRYLRHAGLRPFVYYRIVFGIIVIALAFIRRPA
jgi:undecaprenyl-diphosphatase